MTPEHCAAAHAQWHRWSSDRGVLYAARSRSPYGGSGITVSSDSPIGLEAEILFADGELQTAELWAA